MFSIFWLHLKFEQATCHQWIISVSLPNQFDWWPTCGALFWGIVRLQTSREVDTSCCGASFSHSCPSFPSNTSQTCFSFRLSLASFSHQITCLQSYLIPPHLFAWLLPYSSLLLLDGWNIHPSNFFPWKPCSCAEMSINYVQLKNLCWHLTNN